MQRRLALLAAALTGMALTASAVTINLTVGILNEPDGVTPLADGSTLLVIASTGDASFGALASSNGASALTFTNEADDVILARFAMDSNIVGVPGAHQQAIFFTLGDLGITGGNPLLFVWYSGLDEAGTPTQPGANRAFGTYRAVDWTVPGDNSATIFLTFLTESAEGTLPDAEGTADQVTAGFGDNTAPISVCQDVTRPASANCLVAVSAAEVDGGSSDPDGDPLTLTLAPAGPFGVGSHGVSLIVADNRGGTNTCVATITIQDVTAPTIECPSNISTQLPPGETSVVLPYSLPVVADNCALVEPICVPPPGSVFGVGTTTVACAVSDGLGNTNGCAFLVIVRETPATNSLPVAVCQNVTRAVGTNCSAAITVADVDGGSFDADGDPVTLSIAPAGPFGPGTNAVTLTIADNRGGTSSCVATVITVDQTLPVIACGGNLVTQTVAGAETVVVNFANPSASDNCGAVTVVSTPPSGTAFPVGTNLVTSVATDAAGNTQACEFLVIVQPSDALVRDLAVVRVKGPKAVKLSETNASVTRPVRVTIQNRGELVETIADVAAVVRLEAEALALCGNLNGVLVTEGPITLKPGQKRTLVFNVTFTSDCLPDVRRSTKTQRFDDYRLVATVDRSVIDERADSQPANDQCPRTAAGIDPGCAPVTVDAYVWFW